MFWHDCNFAVLLAVILMIPVLGEYFETGLVPRFPTLIASGFLVIAGLQSLFSGLILSSTVVKDRKDFEYRFNRVNVEKKGKIEKRV